MTCCGTADLGNAGQNLLHCYALLTFADKTALPGFLYFYTCSLNVSLHRIIISIHFPLIYTIWWALTHSARSYLCMNGWCAFSFTTHTEARVTSQWGHKHKNNISRTALRVTLSVFHRFIWVKVFHIIYTVKVFTETCQNKSLKTAAEIFVQQNELLLLKLLKLFFLRNDRTFPTCFNFNSKFPLFAKKV